MKKLIMLVMMIVVSMAVMAEDFDIDSIRLSYDTNVISQIVDITRSVEKTHIIDEKMATGMMFTAVLDYKNAATVVNEDGEASEDLLLAYTKACVMSAIYLTLTSEIREARGKSNMVDILNGDNTNYDSLNILFTEATINYYTLQNKFYIPVFGTVEAGIFMNTIANDCGNRPTGREMSRYEDALSECLNAIITVEE